MLCLFLQIVSDSKKVLAICLVLVSVACSNVKAPLEAHSQISKPGDLHAENSKLDSQNLKQMDDEEIVQWLLLAWENEIAEEKVFQSLLDAGWIWIPDGNNYSNDLGQKVFFAANVTDHIRPEWIVSLLYKDHQDCQRGLPCKGKLVIIGESKVVYELTSDETKSWNFPIATGNFDLNGDGLQDVIATSFRVNYPDKLTSVHVLSNFDNELKSVVDQSVQREFLPKPCESSLDFNDDWNTPGLFIYEGQLGIEFEELMHELAIVYSGFSIPNTLRKWECKQRETWAWDEDTITMKMIESP